MILRILLFITIGFPLTFIVLHTIVRIVRYFKKFPIPQFAANIIDNPFRRRIQPPDETPLRHKIEPGMNVLEVGPGNGTYTVATGRRLGEQGMLYTIDIEPKMIERVNNRIQRENIRNVEARVADVYDLPYADGFFDAVYMIAVIGEIPDPERAMREFYRVLTPEGILIFSELFFDPDYPRAVTLRRMAQSNGFALREKIGNFFYYTLIFNKIEIVRSDYQLKGAL